jgi:hypothetical protein
MQTMKGKDGTATSSAGVRFRKAMDAVLGTGSESADSAYDMRSGTLLTFILSFVLCWIPLFGQAVAGYIGGRKAGSAVRGFIAASVATFGVVTILAAIALALSSLNAALFSDPDAEIAAISATSPLLGQLVSVMISYLRDMFGSASTGALSVNFASYFVTIVFGLVGGVIAEQSQKETRLIIKNGGSMPSHSIRSLELHRVGRKIGFETFDDYTPLSINSLATAPRSDPQPQPIAASKAIRVEKPAPSPITSTVRAQIVDADVTSSTTKNEPTAKANPFANILHKHDGKGKESETVSDSDDNNNFI